MKCASIDSPTKIRTESAFNNHKAIQEEKTIKCPHQIGAESKRS